MCMFAGAADLCSACRWLCRSAANDLPGRFTRWQAWCMHACMRGRVRTLSVHCCAVRLQLWRGGLGGNTQHKIQDTTCHMICKTREATSAAADWRGGLGIRAGATSRAAAAGRSGAAAARFARLPKLPCLRPFLMNCLIGTAPTFAHACPQFACMACWSLHRALPSLCRGAVLQ